MSTYFKAVRPDGTQGEQVAALIDRAGRLTVDEAEKLAVAWGAARVDARDAAWDAAWDAARNAARNAARTDACNAAWDAACDAVCDAVCDATWAAWGAAWCAARAAAIALVVRDLISPEHYDRLTEPWAQVIGPAHPDDKESKQ